MVDVAQGEPTFGESGGFVVELDRFTGPIDLLLHLIREQDIDIFDIPIAQITTQFLEWCCAQLAGPLGRQGR